MITAWAMRRRIDYRRAANVRALHRMFELEPRKYHVCLCLDACHHVFRCDRRMYARVHRRQGWRIVYDKERLPV